MSMTNAIKLAYCKNGTTYYVRGVTDPVNDLSERVNNGVIGVSKYVNGVLNTVYFLYADPNTPYESNQGEITSLRIYKNGTYALVSVRAYVQVRVRLSSGFGTTSSTYSILEISTDIAFDEALYVTLTTPSSTTSTKMLPANVKTQTFSGTVSGSTGSATVSFTLFGKSYSATLTFRVAGAQTFRFTVT